ncbi:LicD family protein [Haemophilus influenzae]|uniref:LicD family protein n=1 Tax=Haemophilus influenzae TaxID=727 RepID=UPI000E59693C|nr:phosphorylcholine transferase LicD [Haemophilus influenzae]
MKKLTLREQQLVCLDILDYFHALCEKHQIHYSLGGGTLIGAIRHKGFIPWDDDIDVYMHRDEYQKFVDVWFQETHEYYNMETAEDILAQYTGEMAKIFDCRTQITDAKGRKSPMFMDIFIYDGVPNEPKIIYPLMKKHRRIKLRFSSCKKRWLRSKENTLQRTILGKLSHFLFSKMQKNLAQFQIKYPIKQCDYIGLVLSDHGGWQKSYMPKEYFNHIVYKEFEGRQFQVMNGYHEHLTQYYGDYMQLPPEEDQKPHHIQEAYIL